MTARVFLMPAIYPVVMDSFDSVEEAQAYIDGCPESVREWLSIGGE